MKQYLDLCRRIIEVGHRVEKKSTVKRCLTVFNADVLLHVAANEFPLVETRKG